ncbi:MAG TPA: cupin domain-containing protein [Steroidobacteraceae bacterium]
MSALPQSVPTAHGKSYLSVMVNADRIAWIPFVLPGTFWKPLYLDDDSGGATFLLKVPLGHSAAKHKHFAYVEAYVVQGGFSYPNEGAVAQGDYIREPGGAVHEPVSEGTEDLILFVVARSGIQGVNPDGSLGSVLDNDVLYECATSGNQHHHLRQKR